MGEGLLTSEVPASPALLQKCSICINLLLNTGHICLIYKANCLTFCLKEGFWDLKIYVYNFYTKEQIYLKTQMSDMYCGIMREIS